MVRSRLRHPPRSPRFQRFSANFAENRRISGQFAFRAGPETGDFDPHSGYFGILSLFRLLLVPRETHHEVLVLSPVDESLPTLPGVLSPHSLLHYADPGHPDPKLHQRFTYIVELRNLRSRYFLADRDEQRIARK